MWRLIEVLTRGLLEGGVMARTGRRPGPSSTRAQILAAAASCFAAAGYDATSLRRVAADAGVDPALVRRFFGGKEQLFTEVASALIDPERALAAVTEGPPSAAGERLLRYFLAMLGEVGQPGPYLGLVRCAVTSVHAALVASQLVGLAVARYAVQLAPLTAAGADELVRWAGPVLQYYLTGNEPVPKEEQS